jgi:hypothetical protein
MFTYPQLNATEQADLPKLIAEPIVMPSKFEDSTHQLWHCQTSEGEMVLKVCNRAGVANSSFWLGLNHLFAADFPKSLGSIHLTHDFLMQYGALNVPDFIAASANRFVLTRFLVGVDLEANAVDEQWVIALAKHIAKLHQRIDQQWGSLHAPQCSANDWPARLQNTLAFLLQQNKVEITAQIQAILAQTNNIKETEFVPMMLDLRWDQLRNLENKSLALIDLDAFVIGPKNLDLVLLRYVLTPVQLLLFKQEYCQTHAWPDDAAQTPCYQLLLFLMNVLGETDLAKWMKQI